jgi:hypothetical protein
MMFSLVTAHVEQPDGTVGIEFIWSECQQFASSSPGQSLNVDQIPHQFTDVGTHSVYLRLSRWYFGWIVRRFSATGQKRCHGLQSLQCCGADQFVFDTPLED